MKKERRVQLMLEKKKRERCRKKKKGRDYNNKCLILFERITTRVFNLFAKRKSLKPIK
jgi:hypothetical protein